MIPAQYNCSNRQPILLTRRIKMAEENHKQEEVLDDISDIRWMDAPVFVIFWGLLVIVFVQFFTRYILNSSLGWTEEIARYLLILLGFVGSITCIRKGSHIYLEFFYRFLPAKVVKALLMFVAVINMVFFTYAGFVTAELAYKTRFQHMVSIEVPKGVIYWTVVAACFGMGLTAAWQVLALLRKKDEEVTHEIEEHVVKGH
jgi:TRAP-type C4-dicarboxylate transport system permease small subunit